MSADHHISEEEFNSTLLLSLPESWDSVVAGFDDSILSETGNLTSRLLAEADRRAHRSGTTNNNSQAFQTGNHHSSSSHSRRPKFKPKNPNVICHHCGIKGHYSKHCHKRQRGEPQTEAGKSARNQSHSARANATTTQTTPDFGFAVITEAEEEEVATAVGPNSNTWLADSAATSHFCNNRTIFQSFTPCSQTVGGYTGKAVIKGRGTIRITLKLDKGQSKEIELRDTAYVPSAKFNLISLPRLADAGGYYTGKGNELRMFYSNGQLMGLGVMNNHLYHVQTVDPSSNSIALITNTGLSRTLREWHNSFAHINEQALKKLSTLGVIKISDPNSSLPLTDCVPCITAKQHHTPLPSQSTTDHSKILPGNLACIDIWGPARTIAIGGYTYSLKIVDHATRWDASEPLKAKSDARTCVQQYQKWIENVTGNKLTTIRVDNAKELAESGDFRKWMKDHGISIQLTAPYTSEQNGIAERAHRTSLEAARAMMIHAALPPQ